MNTYKVFQGGSTEITVQADHFSIDTDVNLLRFYKDEDEDEILAIFYFNAGSYVKKETPA